MKRKIIQWLDKKIFTPLLKRHNAKLWQQWEDRNFLESLCIENRTLDLDKYLKLMSMVKRKYKK